MTDLEKEAAECPKQDRPAKAAGEQLDRLKERLLGKGITPIFGLIVFASDCLHDGKATYHAGSTSTVVKGISPEGRAIDQLAERRLVCGR